MKLIELEIVMIKHFPNQGFWRCSKPFMNDKIYRRKNNQTFPVAIRSWRNFLGSILRWSLFIENSIIFNLSNIITCKKLRDASLGDSISGIKIARFFTISLLFSFIDLLLLVGWSMVISSTTSFICQKELTDS